MWEYDFPHLSTLESLSDHPSLTMFLHSSKISLIFRRYYSKPIFQPPILWTSLKRTNDDSCFGYWLSLSFEWKNNYQSQVVQMLSKSEKNSHIFTSIMLIYFWLILTLLGNNKIARFLFKLRYYYEIKMYSKILNTKMNQNVV